MTNAFLEDLQGSQDALIADLFGMSRFRLDLETRTVHFDKRFGPLLAMEPVSSMSLEEFLERLDPLYQRWYFEQDMKAIVAGRASLFRRDVLLSDANGGKRWFECIARPDVENNGGGGAIIGAFCDISARKVKKTELSESERWFKEVLEESPHAMYRIDLRKNRFDYVSMGFARTLGFSREEILRMPYADFVGRFHPADIQRVYRAYEEKVLTAGDRKVTLYFELRFLHAEGHYIWIDDTFTIVPDSEGQAVYQVGFGSAIEERKRLEEELKKSHERLEERVRERTKELDEANRRLEKMMSERRELEKKLLEISERERRFIGRELHDGLCQQIAGVMCMSDAVQRKLELKKVPEEAELGMMRDFLHDAVQQTRTLARGLCPLALDPQAIGDALATLASQTSYLYKVDCRYEGGQALALADPDAALHLYRITQEGIQNSIRHGGAKKVRIGLQELDGEMLLRVDNNGAPLSKNSKDRTKGAGTPEGLGLRLIDYRSGLLGGTWNISDLADDQGVRLEVRVALKRTPGLTGDDDLHLPSSSPVQPRGKSGRRANREARG